MNPLSFALAHALPELILAVGALVLLLVGAVRSNDSGNLVTGVAVGVLSLAVVVLLVGRGVNIL